MFDKEKIDVLEVSLTDAPKNRRRFVALKGSTVVTGIPEAATVASSVTTPEIPAAETETETPTEQSAVETETEAPVEQADAATGEVTNDEAVALVVRSAYQTVVAAQVPPEAAQALRYIVERTGVDVADVGPRAALDEEQQVHVMSLLAAVPADAPEDVRSAAAVVQAWEQEGFPLKAWEMPSDTAIAVAPPPAQSAQRRVLDAEHLAECAMEEAREMLESGGDVASAAELMAFCRKIKKALPDGGFVVVSGVVPRSEDVPMVNLADLWKSSDTAASNIIQSIIEDASMTAMSEADKVRADCAAALDAFGKDVLSVLSTATDHDGALQQMQEAFNNVGAKLPAFVDRLHPQAVPAQPSPVIQEMADRLARLERSMTAPKSTIPFTPPPPQPRSIRSAVEFAPPPKRGAGLTATQLVEAASRRHLARLPF